MPRPKAINNKFFSTKGDTPFDYFTAHSDVQKLFEKYAEKEHASNNINFIRELYSINKRINEGIYDENEKLLSEELEKLYDTYVNSETSGDNFINLPMPIAKALSEKRTQRKFEIGSFLPALNDSRALLMGDIVLRFIEKYNNVPLEFQLYGQDFFNKDFNSEFKKILEIDAPETYDFLMTLNELHKKGRFAGASQNDFQDLYEKYIHKDAPRRINISDTLSKSIGEKIEKGIATLDDISSPILSKISETLVDPSKAKTIKEMLGVAKKRNELIKFKASIEKGFEVLGLKLTGETKKLLEMADNPNTSQEQVVKLHEDVEKIKTYIRKKVLTEYRAEKKSDRKKVLEGAFEALGVKVSPMQFFRERLHVVPGNNIVEKLSILIGRGFSRNATDPPSIFSLPSEAMHKEARMFIQSFLDRKGYFTIPSLEDIQGLKQTKKLKEINEIFEKMDKEMMNDEWYDFWKGQEMDLIMKNESKFGKPLSPKHIEEIRQAIVSAQSETLGAYRFQAITELTARQNDAIPLPKAKGKESENKYREASDKVKALGIFLQNVNGARTRNMKWNLLGSKPEIKVSLEDVVSQYGKKTEGGKRAEQIPYETVIQIRDYKSKLEKMMLAVNSLPIDTKNLSNLKSILSNHINNLDKSKDIADIESSQEKIEKVVLLVLAKNKQRSDENRRLAKAESLLKGGGDKKKIEKLRQEATHFKGVVDSIEKKILSHEPFNNPQEPRKSQAERFGSAAGTLDSLSSNVQPSSEVSSPILTLAAKTTPMATTTPTTPSSEPPANPKSEDVDKYKYVPPSTGRSRPRN